MARQAATHDTTPPSNPPDSPDDPGGQNAGRGDVPSYDDSHEAPAYDADVARTTAALLADLASARVVPDAEIPAHLADDLAARMGWVHAQRDARQLELIERALQGLAYRVAQAGVPAFARRASDAIDRADRAEHRLAVEEQEHDEIREQYDELVLAVEESLR